MKRLNYACLFSLCLISLVACTGKLENINTDPNKFVTATPDNILVGVFKRTNDLLAYRYQESGQWMYGLPGSGRYDFSDNGGFWTGMYVNILQPLRQLITEHEGDTAFTNRVQIARIWQNYVYAVLTANYGPVPVKQANTPDQLSNVPFDPEDTVYTIVLANLKDAVGKMRTTSTIDKLTTDVIYGGDLLKWKKFGNTLRLRIALRCLRNVSGVAEQTIREVMADESNLIGSEAETAKLAYENVIGNEHPFWRSAIKPNNTDLPKLGDFLQVFSRSYKDPRYMVWYDSVPLAKRALLQDTLSSTADDSLRIVTYPLPYYGEPKWATLIPGWSLPNPPPTGVPANLSQGVYSNISAQIFGSGSGSLAQAARPLVILGYAEAQFLKAEARLRGYGGGQTAEAYYNAGIDANFAYWFNATSNPLVNTASRDAYKAVDGIKWGTTGKGYYNYLGIVKQDINDDTSKIWIQEWLAFWPDQNFDFWCLQRRTQVLNLAPHTNPGGNSSGAGTPYIDLPQRGAYPLSLITYNVSGYNQGLQLLGVSSQSDEQYNPYLNLRFARPFKSTNWAVAPASYNLRYLQKWYGTTIQELKSAAATGGFTYTLIRAYRP
jgi:hypothetical protein